MIKIAALINRKPDVSPEEFLRLWNEEHPPLVTRLPGLKRYQQNHPVPHREPWPWDGLAELWFEDKAAVRAAFQSPQADELRRHEELFIEEYRWFLVDEVLKFDAASERDAEGES
jgi:uncharacterized protein (TIGR02118 family)